MCIGSCVRTAFTDAHLRDVKKFLDWAFTQKKIEVTTYATHTLYDPEDYLKKCGGADKVMSMPTTDVFTS